MKDIKVSEYLFYLIKSLTQAEKRYFKINSNFQKGKDKGYIQIFNLIDKMEQYDDEPLLELMKGSKQKLAVNKNFLYDKILKSLRIFNESAIDIELTNLIADVRILMEKGLFQPALKRLKKTRKIAMDYEKSPFLMEIIDIETDIKKEIVNKKIQEEFEELFRQTNETVDVYSEFVQLKKLSRKLYNFFIIDRKKQKLPEAWVNEIKALPESSDSLRSFHAKTHYHSALGYYFRLMDNMKAQKEQFGLLVDLWRQHPEMIKNRYQKYRIELSNYVTCCLKNDDFEGVLDLIDEIRAIPAKSKYEKASDFQNTAFLELQYYMRIGELGQAVALEDYIEKNIIVYRGLITKSREITFYHHMMVSFFGQGDYKKASKWLNKILYDDKSEPGKDAKRFAWIMEVIIHYKAENDEVVEWLYKKADFPLKEDEPHRFAEIALGYLKKIMKAPITERKALFKNFRKDLGEYKADNRHFGMEVLSIWIESNIANMSFEEVMKERMLLKQKKKLTPTRERSPA